MNATKHSPAPFAVVGIVAAAFFAVMWIVAAQGDASWVLGESTVSDLGISANDDTANEFMYGCIITGILVIVFGAGKAYCENGASTAAGLFIAAAGLFLALLGIFDKNYGNGDAHQAFAYLCFIFIAVGAVCSMFGDHAEGKKINAAITGALILIVVGAVVGKELAYYEAVATVCALLWLVSESVKMIFDLPKMEPVQAAAVAVAAVEEAPAEELAGEPEDAADAAPAEDASEAPAEEKKE